ncbi:hypothetical protein [Candidatus Avelusimicrobium fimicolum]|uniref:hypothetical protein n=1 Tax=Candidatus Avelusimicrobium fimicolum TaxID=3416216 RepID=UPI003D10237E
MGLTDAEFWELSFKEFDLLKNRQELAEYRSWERTASLMCVIFNAHRGKHQRALKVKDVLKNPFEKPASASDVAAMLKELTKRKGGSINGKQNT